MDVQVPTRHAIWRFCLPALVGANQGACAFLDGSFIHSICDILSLTKRVNFTHIKCKINFILLNKNIAQQKWIHT
jgi:hypothetical protein